MKMKKFPKTLYITRQNAGTSEEYFQALTIPVEAEHGELVATYDLRAVDMMDVKRKLIPLKNKRGEIVG